MTQDVRDRLALSEVVCSKVKPLCAPLAHEFGIHTFGYRKFFADGTCFNTSSNFEWTKFVQEKFSSLILPNYEEELKSALTHEKHFVIRVGEPDPQDLHLFTLYECDVWNTLSLYQKNEEGVDAFYFTSTRSNYGIVEEYLNNLSFFEKFACDFKHTFTDILPLKDIKKSSTPTVSPTVFENHNEETYAH
jgi:hypothetical protein